MKIRNQGELRKAIVQSTYQISDKELFLSDIMLKFVQTIVDAVTKQYQTKIKVLLYWADDDSTASTNGKYLICNVNNTFAKDVSRHQRAQIMIAMILHECSHILHTDFSLMEQIDATFEKDGVLIPNPGTSEFNKMETAIKTNKKLASVLLSLRDTLDNCLEDGYVDKCIIREVEGYGQNLKELSALHCSEIPNFKQMQDEDYNTICIYTNQILHYAKAGYLKAEEDDLDNDVMRSILNMCPHIDTYRDEHDSIKRAKITNQLLALMFDDIQQMVKENQEPSQSENDEQAEESQTTSSKAGQNLSDENSYGSKGGLYSSNKNSVNNSGSSELTEEDIRNIYDTLDKVLKSLSEDMTNSSDQSHQNMDSPISKIQQDKVSDQLKDNNSDSSSASIPLSNEFHQDNNNQFEEILNNISKQIAEQNVAKEQEKAIEEELKNELSAVHDPSSPKDIQALRKVKGCITRENKIDTYWYDIYAKELNAYVNRLTKELERELKNRQNGGIERGLYSGTHFVPSRLSSPDKKLFAKRKAPEDYPEMAICIMVDMSGSTSGKRIEAERKTAYIIYAFCQKINIPCAVYGFYSIYPVTSIISYAEFDSFDKKDLMRICNIGSKRAANRDGYALKFCSERLMKRPEANKIMISISDGQPSDYINYGMREGKMDIQDTLKKYSGKSITYITAAIGDDAERIREIYCQGLPSKAVATFLDIQDLEKLPKALIKILKKRIA